MNSLVASGQMLAGAGLIWITVVQSWKAGNKFWSSRADRG
jgi:hypothetical protein